MNKYFISIALYLICFFPVNLFAQLDNAKLEYINITEIHGTLFIAGYIYKNPSEIFWLTQTRGASELHIYNINTKKSSVIFNNVKIPASAREMRIAPDMDRLVYSDSNGLYLLDIHNGKSKILIKSKKLILRFHWMNSDYIGYEGANSRSINLINLNTNQKCTLIQPKIGLVIFDAYSQLTKEIVYQLTNVGGLPSAPNDATYRASWDDCKIHDSENIKLPDIYTEGVNSISNDGKLIAYTGVKRTDTNNYQNAYIEDTTTGKWMALTSNQQWYSYEANLSPDKKSILLLNAPDSGVQATMMSVAKIPTMVLHYLTNHKKKEKEERGSGFVLTH